jgi:hypothetical protein
MVQSVSIASVPGQHAPPSLWSACSQALEVAPALEPAAPGSQSASGCSKSARCACEQPRRVRSSALLYTYQRAGACDECRTLFNSKVVCATSSAHTFIPSTPHTSTLLSLLHWMQVCNTTHSTGVSLECATSTRAAADSAFTAGLAAWRKSACSSAGHIWCSIRRTTWHVHAFSSPLHGRQCFC